MKDQLPFRADILKIMKYNLAAKSGAVYERTSTDYELDLYVSGNRSMQINQKSYDIEAGSLIFRRPGDHTISRGSYNCYTMTLDLSGEKKELCGVYDRNDPSNTVQARSDNPLLEQIPSHFVVGDLSAYIEIYDQLCYLFQNVQSKDAISILLNRLLFLALSDVFHTMYGNTDHTRESRVLTETCKYVQENFHRPISIEELAANVSFSPSYFCKLFKKAASITPAEYVISVRLSNAKLLLSESDLTMSQISELCGFCDASYFSYNFKQRFGKTPMEYRLTKCLPLAIAPTILVWLSASGTVLPWATVEKNLKRWGFDALTY